VTINWYTSKYKRRKRVKRDSRGRRYGRGRVPGKGVPQGIHFKKRKDELKIQVIEIP